jgi:hypothetical protein
MLFVLQYGYFVAGDEVGLFDDVVGCAVMFVICGKAEIVTTTVEDGNLSEANSFVAKSAIIKHFIFL